MMRKREQLATNIGLDEDVVSRGAVVELLPELGGLGRQLLVTESLYLFFEGIDLLDDLAHPLDLAIVASTEN